MPSSLTVLADAARPRPPLTAQERSEAQAVIDAAYPGAVLIEWAPPERIEPETLRERTLYQMGYHDGWIDGNRG